MKEYCWEEGVPYNRNIFKIRSREELLCDAMLALLKRQSFGKITVRGICQEALISRATFYAHFIDKYDLLKYWLMRLKPENANEDIIYEQMENLINEFIRENETIIKNIVYDVDCETFELLFEAILSILNLTIEKNNNGNINPKYVVLSNIYAGGIFCYLFWQIKNNFPSAVPPMNKYLYEIMKKFSEWESE